MSSPIRIDPDADIDGVRRGRPSRHRARPGVRTVFWLFVVVGSLAVGSAGGADEVEPPPVQDPTRYWPDPVSDLVDLGAEQRFYRLARTDGRSLLSTPSVGDPLRIWVGGDSLSGGPAWGVEALTERDARYELVQDIRKSTGVITEWFFDWRQYLRDDISPAGYDVIVLSMGGNDGQRFSGHPELVGSPEWQARYRERLTEMVHALDAPGRLVVWVGMPAVEPPQIVGLPAIVNPLAAAVMDEFERAYYVDASALVSPDGVFVTHLIDANGNERKVRVPDGVHYTISGGVLIGEQLMALIAANTAATP